MISGKRFVRNLAAALLALLPPFLVAQPAPSVLDRQLASEVVEVVTTAGRSYRGLLDGFREDRLYLRRATDGGEVGYSFSPDEIATLTLPGADFEAAARELIERDREADALPLLEALGRQRFRYLQVLTAEQRQPLWLLLGVSRRHGDPHATLGFARQLQSAATTPSEKTAVLEAEIEAFVALNQPAEACRLAARWCELAGPAETSVLGWSVLARAAFDAGDFDRARWIALQPVALCGFLARENLDTCYAIAVTAADHLQDPAHALALMQEMRDRGLDWPADPAFAATGRHYAEAIAAGSEPVTPANLPPIVAPTPTSTAPSTLDQVQKLVRASSSL